MPKKSKKQMSSSAATSQAKLEELLEGIRQEFAAFSKEATTSRLQNQKDYDYKINLHLAEMQQIRNAVYELELSHRKMKDSYEEEINKLKLEITQKDHQIATLTQQLQQQSPSIIQPQLPPQPQQLPQPRLPSAVQPQPAAQPVLLPQTQIQQAPQSAAVSEQTTQPIQQLPQQQVVNGISQQPNGPALAPLISALGSQLKSPNVASTNDSSASETPQLPQIQHVATEQKPVSTPQLQPLNETQILPAAAGVASSASIAQKPATATIEPSTAQQVTEVAKTTQVDETASPVSNTTTTLTTSSTAASTNGNKTTSATTSNKKKSTSKDSIKSEAANTDTTTSPPVRNENSKYLVAPDQRASQMKAIPPFLLDLDYNQVPENLKKRESDYYVLYNPALPRNIEIDLHSSLEHSSVVCCVKFSNDGQYLATGCNKTTQVYRVSDGALIAKLSDDSAPSVQNGNNISGSTNGTGKDGNDNSTASSDLYIRSVCFSPDGKYLATGAEDRLIRIWDIENKKIVMVLQGHDQDVYSLDYFPSGDKLVSGSGDRTVRIWDLKTGQCSLILSIEDGVTTVAVSPGDGKFIAAGSLDRAVRVWDSETGFLVERLDSENELGTGHKDSVYSVVFTKDGKKVVSGSLDRSVKLWNLHNVKENGQTSNSAVCEVTYIGHKDFVLSVTTTNNDQYVLSGSKDRGVLFWDTNTGNPLLMLQGHRNSVISVAVANGSPLGPNCQVFATGSGDCRARIWKFTNTQDAGKIEDVKS